MAQKQESNMIHMLNLSTKFTGTGGNCSSLSKKKEGVTPKLKKTGVFQEKKTPKKETSIFRRFYDQSDLPIQVNFSGIKRIIVWRIDPEFLDYSIYLPIFFDGLSETEEPYKFIAQAGCQDLLEKGKDKTFKVLPQLILPIKKALETKNHWTMCRTLEKLQLLVFQNPLVGEALVPYYRNILPVINMFKNKRNNFGDDFDYSQRKNEDLGEIIQETLELLEKYGGPNAYMNIKYMVPTYETCMF